METPTPASRTEVWNYETTLRIRERIVRVTAEKLLEAIDADEPTDYLIAHLREALVEAQVADDQHFAALYGTTLRPVAS